MIKDIFDCIYQDTKTAKLHIAYKDGTKSKGFDEPYNVMVQVCMDVVHQVKSRNAMKRLAAEFLVRKAIKKSHNLHAFTFTMDEEQFWKEYVYQNVAAACLLNSDLVDDVITNRVVGPAKDLFKECSWPELLCQAESDLKK